ncbi:MAG: ATP-binding cassette domain-containing protein [Proteobacteria bacterium]|nr:ATP-binding cassette domain-containing protein [Pseudomonadota bacterium]
MYEISEIIRCENISKTFIVKKGFFEEPLKIQALKNVNLNINRDEIVGLVGESGSGKSTLAKIILKLLKPDSGRLFFLNSDITNASEKDLSSFRKNIQVIFQDPMASLNPRRRIIDSVSEPLFLQKSPKVSEGLERCERMLLKVGIESKEFYKFPHELSGGQRQRVNIARALVTEPLFIVADEPVSSLDVSIQAEIINLLIDLKRELSFSMLFISHDLRVVRHLSDRVYVIFKGEIVEEGLPTNVFSSPAHPYTKSLLENLFEV